MRGSLLPLLPILASTVLVAADVNQLVTSLKTLSSSLTQLTNDTKAVVKGLQGFPPALQVSVQAISVDNQIINTTALVKGSSILSAADSKTVLSELKSLQSAANASLAETSAKVDNFAGLSPIVLSTLYALKIDQGNLGLAFATKLDPSTLVEGAKILQSLNVGFDQAIKVYGGGK